MDIQSFNFSTEKNYKKPEIYTDSNVEYVKYGSNNQLPYELLNYYTNSSINRAIIQKKTQMFKGKKITFDTKNVNIDKKTQNFIDSVNPQESLKEVLGKIALDIFIFGGAYLQIIWSKNGKNIVEIYNMPFAQMRSGKANDSGFVEKFYFNPSSEKIYQYKTYTDIRNLIEFPAFNTKKNKNKPQILFIKKEEPSNIYYPLPDYISSLTALDTDVEIDNFHNSSIYNGFNPGVMIIFNGIEPSQEEKDKFMKKINEKYKGSDNSNRVIVFYNDGDSAPTIQQMDVSDIDKKFETLSESTIQKIVSGHQIPRALASIAQPGSLGNTKEILESTKIFIDQYIQPHQELVLNQINKIMRINKLNDIEIINPNVNISIYSIKDLVGILTINELREFLGYDSIDNNKNVTPEQDINISQGDNKNKNNISTDEQG